jgi:hypothetical protein
MDGVAFTWLLMVDVVRDMLEMVGVDETATRLDTVPFVFILVYPCFGEVLDDFLSQHLLVGADCSLNSTLTGRLNAYTASGVMSFPASPIRDQAFLGCRSRLAFIPNWPRLARTCEDNAVFESVMEYEDLSSRSCWRTALNVPRQEQSGENTVTYQNSSEKVHDSRRVKVSCR